jgi:hypothetical protein
MKPASKAFEPELVADLLLFFLAVFACTSTAGAQTAGAFTATGNMTTPRIDHTATLLYDGTVLIAGGRVHRLFLNHVRDSLGTAELYDPASGIFKSIANMITPRADHSATLLADGRVLIAGGRDSQGGWLASAEIYDPSTRIFTATGSMSIPRAGHTATLLNSGKVLIAGGLTASGIYLIGESRTSAEVYDPATGAFTATGDMAVARYHAKAILLPDGKVFIASGDDGFGAELFDPDRGTFSRTGWVDFRVFPAAYAGAVGLLANGNVFVTLQPPDGEWVSRTTAVYDVAAGTLIPATDMIYGRNLPAGTTLSDGTVLITGGGAAYCTAASARAEIYDAAGDGSSVTGDMVTGRYFHTTTLLNDGRVLIAGGRDYGCEGPALASAELYVPSVLVPVPVVTGLRFDRSSVATGSSYSINFSGPSLTDEVFFDVRFIAPGSNDSVVLLNWQKGLTTNHSVPVITPSGIWTINGVRAHKIETDHTSNFFPVSGMITVSP